jgi:hypothetical protein
MIRSQLIVEQVLIVRNQIQIMRDSMYSQQRELAWNIAATALDEISKLAIEENQSRRLKHQSRRGKDAT